ncbi:MAG TPA: nuclear transport factor 2 family protein [Jiangellaceae bacterium]
MTESGVLARRVYEAVNAQDLAAIDQLFAPDVVRHARREVGIDAARRSVVEAFAAAPSLRFVVEDVLSDGDRAALRVTVRGVPTGPDGVPPTILEIFRFHEDKVVEIWGAGTS